MDGRDVKGTEALVLELAMFERGAFFQDKLRNGVGHVSVCDRADVALNDCGLAAFLHHNQIPRMNGSAGLGGGGHENEVNRQLSFLARGNVDETAILEK